MGDIILGSGRRPTAFYVGKTVIQQVYKGDENVWGNFSPEDVDGLEIWLDAQDDTYMHTNAENKISSWQDKVNNYTFIQNDGGNQPIFETNVQNGYGAIKFDGNDRLHTTSLPIQDGTASYFIVAKTLGYCNQTIYTRAAGKTLFIGAGVGIGNRNFTALFGNGTSWNSSSVALSPLRTLGNDFHVLGIVNDGTNNITGCQPTHDGEKLDTVNGNHASFSDVNIGSYSNENNGWDGYICEILVYNKALTSSEREKTEGWLAWKWGINSNLANDHPHANSRPVV